MGDLLDLIRRLSRTPVGVKDLASASSLTLRHQLDVLHRTSSKCLASAILTAKSFVCLRRFAPHTISIYDR
jgi:hypothetical protein